MSKCLRYHSPNIKVLSGLAVLLATISVAFAQTPGNGELAAAIRSADFPCAHVIEVAASGDNAWRVQCNSGAFVVRKAETGEYSVSPSD